MSGLVTIIMAILLLAAPTSNAIVVDVPSGKVKCLTEDLRKGALTYAQYIAVNASSGNGKSHTISARVTDPRGDALHHAEGVESGEFYFEAAVEGRHTACFWSPRFELAASLSVDLEWRVGVRSRAGKEAAAAGGSPLGTQLKQLEDAVGRIREEMVFLRDREMDARRLNEETASWMTSLTFCSLGVCLAVAFLQLWHLHTFFHAKKIL